VRVLLGTGALQSLAFIGFEELGYLIGSLSAPVLEAFDRFDSCAQMLNVEGLIIDREYEEGHSLRRYDAIHDCALGFGCQRRRCENRWWCHAR
jgi:hypothetical protein